MTQTQRQLILAATFFLLIPSSPAAASYAIYVGKQLTADGSVLVGGTGEEVSSHYLRIEPRRRHPPNSTLTVGVTKEAQIPGALIRIAQMPLTFRYISMDYTDYRGFPPPLTNGGMNEHQVAVRDVWSPARKELVSMTPTPQRGPQYSDLARIALQRARSARQAVAIIGQLIERHGYSTYGGNSHLIADPNEGWVLIALPGGKRLWIAERLGPKDIRVLYPGYIEEIPDNFYRHPGFLGSKRLIDFAVKQGWFTAARKKRFNVYKVYGRGQGTARAQGIKFVDPATLEQELRRHAPRITLQQVMALVRDPRLADEEAGYGQVAQLRTRPHRELALLWVAPTGSVTAPFIPYRIGVQRVPAEFRQHRYLTKGAATHFLHPDFQAQEATEFAGRLFKRLMYFTCEHPDRFLPEVTKALTAFEGRLIAEQAEVEQTALALYGAGKAKLARNYLTLYTNTRARQALDLGRALLQSIEQRTRLLWGIREPRGAEINSRGGQTPNCLRGADPDRPAKKHGAHHEPH